MDTLDYFDKISKQWIKLEVKDEIGTFLKRSYWREDAQERRYYTRKLDFEDDLDYETYLLTESCEDEVVNRSIIVELYSAVGELSLDDKLLIYLRYFRDLKLRDISAYIGISEAQVSRRLKKICQGLRVKLSNIQ